MGYVRQTEIRKWKAYEVKRKKNERWNLKRSFSSDKVKLQFDFTGGWVDKIESPWRYGQITC